MNSTIKKILKNTHGSILFLFLQLIFTWNTMSGEIQIMSYNVQNLFDTNQDIDSKTGVDKVDWEFLPAQHPSRLKGCKEKNKEGSKDYKYCIENDWNDKKVDIKLNQIKKVILDSRTQLPDMLALQEVENDKVVSQLANTLGFTRYEMTDSPDIRGIDVALLFNENTDVTFLEKKEYALKGKRFEEFPTRNLLEVTFMVEMKHKLFVYVNHWPSQAAPSEVRAQVAEQLLKQIEKRTVTDPDAYFILMGDFNVIANESPDPFQDVLLNSQKAPLLLLDAHEEFMASKKVDEKLKTALPSGTYYYGKNQEWNRFDRFFYSSNFSNPKSGMTVPLESYEIYSPDFIKNQDIKSPYYEAPLLYKHFGPDAYTKPGFSDHFPVSIHLEY